MTLYEHMPVAIRQAVDEIVEVLRPESWPDRFAMLCGLLFDKLEARSRSDAGGKRGGGGGQRAGVSVSSRRCSMRSSRLPTLSSWRCMPSTRSCTCTMEASSPGRCARSKARAMADDSRRMEYSALIGRMERTLREADDALAAATAEVKDSRHLARIANARTAIAKRMAEVSALFDITRK